MQHLHPRHFLAAVVIYALFAADLDPKLIALVAGLLYVDNRGAGRTMLPGP